MYNYKVTFGWMEPSAGVTVEVQRMYETSAECICTQRLSCQTWNQKLVMNLYVIRFVLAYVVIAV